MSQPAEWGLSPEEVASLFPFHLGFDDKLRLVQLGPSLKKLVPGAALGEPLTEHFTFEAPPLHAFSSLRRFLGTQVVLRPLRCGAQLRGQLLLHPSPRRLLLLCSPWLTSPQELPQLGLLPEDFALHDCAAELVHTLAAHEASLADVRKLMTRLAAQRREQRAEAARLQALHEVCGLFAGAACLEAVSRPLLERAAGIAGVPVVALWLREHGAGPRYIHVTQGASADGCARRLAERLRGASLEQAPIEAAALGFSSISQLPIEGRAGQLGSLAFYGAAVMDPELARPMRDAAGELVAQLAQFLDKAQLAAAVRELCAPVAEVLALLDAALAGELAAEARGSVAAARRASEQLSTRVHALVGGEGARAEASFEPRESMAESSAGTALKRNAEASALTLREL